MSSTFVNNDDSNKDPRGIRSIMESSRANLSAKELSLVKIDNCQESFLATEGCHTNVASHHGREEDFMETSPDAENGMNQPPPIQILDVPSEENETPDVVPHRTISPVDSFLSIPDELSPSARSSVLSSPAGSLQLPGAASRPSLESPTPSFRPFDRRFQSHLSSSSLSSLRSSFLKSHSYNTSLSSKFQIDTEDKDPLFPPWDAVRWTKLKRINDQVFSEVGKRNFGVPSCISISTSVVLGTSKGIILIFDYHQNLKSVVGTGTKAVEAGPLTSIAVSADYQVIAGGHANGSIFTWNIAKTTHPFLHIPSLDHSQLMNRSQDGHMANVAVRHLGFLGVRHTALVSANDNGMAFSHLATRGLGTITRSVKTTRILGRYPNDTATHGKSHTPSAILALSPLPLGNVERGTDTMGLTAILTPQLLVVISTTPIAQTQFKTGKPRDFDNHSTLSGCLSWFPAVKLKFPETATGREVSNVKLVYCWANILTVLEVDEIDEIEHPDCPPSLSFKARSRLKFEEAIVAVQWLSRSILVVLTITHRLIILEDGAMRVTEILDLINKHIYHEDIFSNALKSLAKHSENCTQIMQTTVADAYHMSFKIYKSRMFILGLNHVSIGTLSNWADRLIAGMRADDYVGAILFATSCYTGDVDKIMIGLPEDSNSRYSMVRDKLVEIIRNSLESIFSSQQEQSHNERDDDRLRDLAEACSEACLCIEDYELLFDEIFEWFEKGNSSGIFFKALETHILEERITVVPPTIMKNIVSYYVSQEHESRLEEIICHIKPSSLDIDQVTTLCRQHNLYDAFIYVWNRALSDYITPLIEILSLLLPLTANEFSASTRNAMDNDTLNKNTLKLFPYLSYIFTGRIYPTGEPLVSQESINAKAQSYWFLFSGQNVEWPKNSGRFFLTQSHQAPEPTFPYLRMILKLDAPSFLSVMNEAFEDSFLNENPEQIVRGSGSPDLPKEQHLDISINRQYIISILLEVMNPRYFPKEDMIFLDMFIARNLPKFPQYILLPSSTMHKVLLGLCDYPAQEIGDDAQLSVEYLLSVYRPADLQSLLPLFQKTGFFRVLKNIYKSEKQFCKLLETHFEDLNDQTSVYECICDCLRRSDLTKRQIGDIKKVLVTHATDLLHLNTTKTAQILDTYAPELHKEVIEVVSGEPKLQFFYLQTLFEEGAKNEGVSELPSDFLERYVLLMCKFNPQHVAAYVEKIQISHLHLDRILPIMEKSGATDAAVFLMARDENFEEAMDRLIKHIKKLEALFLGIISRPDEETQLVNGNDSISSLLEALIKYTNVGIWLCQSRTDCATQQVSSAPKKNQAKSAEAVAVIKLIPEEGLWLDLIDASIQTSRNLSTHFESFCESNPSWKSQCDLILGQLRTPVQLIFSSLLSLTSTNDSTQKCLSFIRILRAFLARAAVSLPNLADLQAVLASVFSAYTYEEKILKLTNRLLEKDLFINVQNAISSRERGWAPRTSTCEGCGERLWGLGVSGDIYSKWEEREIMIMKQRQERALKFEGGFIGRGKAPFYPRYSNGNKTTRDEAGESPGKSILPGVIEEDSDQDEEKDHRISGQQACLRQPGLGPLVVLACKHTYHQSCLEKIQGERNSGLESKEFKCPIDG